MNTEVYKLKIFEDRFESLMNQMIENKTNSLVIGYEPSTGGTFNILKWSNYLALKSFNVLIVTRDKFTIKYLKSFLSNRVEVVYHTKVNEKKDNKYDFVFYDRCDFDLINTSFKINLLRI